MINRTGLLAAAALACLSIPISVEAKERGDADPSNRQNWIVKIGLSNLDLADKLDLQVGGSPFPGAGMSTSQHQTVSLQVTRFMSKNVAINAIFGFPPTVAVNGAGSIGSLQRLGKVTYGPTALTIQYHPFRHGKVRPYVGAGMSYMIVFGTEDGAFSNLGVGNDLGPALEAGVEVMLDRKHGLFVEVKKALLRPKATGSFMGLNVNGKTRIDPWALSGGVAVHF